MKLGVIAIARPTFDVPFAESKARQAYESLVASSIEVVGSPDLMMTLTDVTDAASRLVEAGVDAMVVLQASFADSSLIVEATDTGLSTVLWAFPEERTGGRLRLNSFCGINLGGFTLAQLGRRYEWILAAPDDPSVARTISRLVEEPTLRPPISRAEHVGDGFDDAIIEADMEAADGVKERLARTTIGRVGDRPDGFEPCAYEAETLRSILGVTVDEVPLPELFARASAAQDSDVASTREKASAFLAGVDTVDQPSLDKSLRLNVGLQSLIREGGWEGVATRCWPETFTEFGGAACTPMALLAEDGTPGSCEADVYGNITGLVLGWLGQSASFVADLVDLDLGSDTGVLWHCGLAPFEMADPDIPATATIHSNRRKPLLSEFPLKPGRVTIARFSQSRGVHRLVIGGGEMLQAPLAFSGTAGVIRFDNPVRDVLTTIMSEGLEHHYGIVYADVISELRALARLLDLPVVEM